MPVPEGSADPALRLADAVLAHHGVARLDGGPFGTIASHRPGRRIPGVRIGVGDEPVELAVVVRPGVPLPRLADELAAVVHGVLGPVPVDVTFADVDEQVAPPEAAPDSPEVAGGHLPRPVT